MLNAPSIASIFPLERRLDKWNFHPQKVWYVPPVPKGSAPYVIQFFDQYEKVYRGSDGRFNMTFGEERITAEQIAEDFIHENTRFPIGQKRNGLPGIWRVGSLGEDRKLSGVSASNSPSVHLRLSAPHGMNGSSDVTISGAQGFWGSINGQWTATPIDELQISIPIDSTRLGDYHASGSACEVNIKRILPLDQEAEIMRKKQDIFFEQWLEDARRLSEAKKPHLIGPIHRIAPAWLGVAGETWMVKRSSNDMMNCHFCQELISSLSVKCPRCMGIVNPVEYARIEDANKKAISAENERLKQERLAQEKEMRERNKELAVAHASSAQQVAEHSLREL